MSERGVCIAGNNEEDEGEDELEREKREKRRRRGEKRTSEDGYSPPEWTKVRIHRPLGVTLIYTSILYCFIFVSSIVKIQWCTYRGHGDSPEKPQEFFNASCYWYNTYDTAKLELSHLYGYIRLKTDLDICF